MLFRGVHMKFRSKSPFAIALIALATVSTAHAGAYNFGGNCPSQGAWTQQAKLVAGDGAESDNFGF